jgi:ligand-binding sensor domain-containing protein
VITVCLAALTAVCGVAPAAALDPQRAMSQYIRDQWGIEKGFPGGRVHAIAQTVDGYLWIASDKGLVRFDGFTFRLIPLSGVTSEPGSAVLGLASDAAGTLWARLQGPALARYRNGAFENMLATLDLPDSLVTAMTPGNDGAMLLATLGHGAVAYRMGQFSSIAAQAMMPSSFVISMAQTSDGDVWLGTRDSGLLRVQGQRVTPITTGLPDQKINCLLEGDNHDLWIGTDNGVVRWNGTSVTSAGIPATLGRVRALSMARDRDANIWLATASHGLIRMNALGVTSTGARDVGPGGTITAVFEDRDRNLWVGTTDGIERWRNGVFTTYATAQGLPSDSSGPVYVDSTRTWFAPSRGGLYWLRNGHVERITQAGLAEDVIYSIAGDGSDVWVGRQRGGLTRLRGHGDAFTAERFTHADGLAQDSVYAVYRARDGAVWAGTLSGGVSRLKDGAFTSYTVTNGLASNTISAILETADGTMWFATPTGVSILSRGGWRRYTTHDGLPSNDVNTLVEDSAGHVWAGTSGGLALISAGQVQRAFKPPDALRRSILGLTDDRAGWLWIVTAESVVRVNREQLVHGAPGEGDVREYGLADGLLSLEGVKRHRSVTSDPSGRIWRR